MSDMTMHDVLALPMDDNDADAATIGEYLRKLLSTVWFEKQGFSGKRPFGNSGWQGEVYDALFKAGLISGQVDEDGLVFDHDRDLADSLIQEAIGVAFEQVG